MKKPTYRRSRSLLIRGTNSRIPYRELRDYYQSENNYRSGHVTKSEATRQYCRRLQNMTREFENFTNENFAYVDVANGHLDSNSGQIDVEINQHNAFETEQNLSLCENSGSNIHEYSKSSRRNTVNDNSSSDFALNNEVRSEKERHSLRNDISTDNTNSFDAIRQHVTQNEDSCTCCDNVCFYYSLHQKRKRRSNDSNYNSKRRPPLVYEDPRSDNALPMSIIGLVILIIYLILGMIVFHGVEQNGAVRVTSENDFLLFDFIQEWLERTYNSEFANVTEFLAGALQQLRQNSTELEKFWESKLGKETIWTWPNALFYSFTVITTIGYGNIVPTTAFGKALTIFYGIFGIPLFFSVVSYWGEIVHQLLVKFEKVFLLWSKTLAKSIPTHIRKVIVIFLFLIVFYGLFVLVAACLIDIFRHDEMDFVTSCYFCYVTITSIGFGDYTLLTYDATFTTWLSYIGFMFYVFLSAVGLAGVVIFRVYSCSENYILLADEVS
ncbi:uncharacterized protein LOC142337494 isoform X2 [Convolutriloba macropyga]